MESRGGPEGSETSGGRWQVSLADLIFLVLAAGLAAGLARGARDVWGTRSAGALGTLAVPFARTAGVLVEVAAIWLALILARGLIGLVRRPRTDGEPGRRLRVPMAWRAAAIAVLLGLVMRESLILRVDYPTFSSRMSDAGWSWWYQMREGLLPICAILALIGIALGTGAGLIFTRPVPRRPRPYWLFVPLAAIAGVLFVGLPTGWWTLIPHLILIALEAVNNALPPGSRATADTMSVRLLRAGIEAVPAALACVGLALVVARDIERARRGEPWATTRGGWIFRIVALAAVAAAGAFTALVVIPTVHPHLREGFRLVLDREVLMIILAGFGLASVGLAARVLVPPSGDPPRWLRWLRAAVPIGLLAVVLVSAFDHLPSSTQLDPDLPPIVGRICDAIAAVTGRFWNLLPDSIVMVVSAGLDPERLAWMLSLMLVAAFLLELAFPRLFGDRAAPFDAIAKSPDRMRRCLWLTAGLTTICIVAMPILLVLGQVLVHIRFSIDRWTVDGWPSPF